MFVYRCCDRVCGNIFCAVPESKIDVTRMGRHIPGDWWSGSCWAVRLFCAIK